MVIRWDVEVNYLLKIVQLKGTVLEPKHSKITSRVLIGETLEVIKISKKYEGQLIPFGRIPTKKDQEFVYFEIIFKSTSDCKNFLETIKNKSS